MNEEKLTLSQRAADAVTEFCGSWVFIGVFSLICAGWMVLNSFMLLFGKWDEYPYILLNLALTIVSTFQTPLVMMSQNRQVERDRVSLHGLHEKLDALAREIEEKSKCA